MYDVVKVFISSLCGGRYESVRAKLKENLLNTGMAKVYVFEEQGASVLTAIEHFREHLKDCDLCIFLIDNADPIEPGSGVDKEIDIVRKHKIPALYYFCNETCNEKTLIQARMEKDGQARFFKVLDRFEDFALTPVEKFYNDLAYIFHLFATRRLMFRDEEDANELFEGLIEQRGADSIPKTTLQNIDQCVDYLMGFVRGNGSLFRAEKDLRTGEIDQACRDFLPVMLDRQKVSQYDIPALMAALEPLQSPEHHKVVKARWKAIQAYYLGDVPGCAALTEEALNLARELNRPDWVIDDILIDLRNMQILNRHAGNVRTGQDAQEILRSNAHSVYYPVMDRFNVELYERYARDNYEQRVRSPYTTTIGDDSIRYVERIAASFVIAMFNGSLTHIRQLYLHLRDLFFFLCERDDQWTYRRELLKLTVYEGSKKEIEWVRDAYPEIMNRLSAEDALEIILFCDNHPIREERSARRFQAFAAVGYYLDRHNYDQYESQLVSYVRAWMQDDVKLWYIGPAGLFDVLAGVAQRMPQETIAEICCEFMEKRLVHWYSQLFKYMDAAVDLRRMKAEDAQRLIQCIINIMEDEKGLEAIKEHRDLLTKLRWQDLHREGSPEEEGNETANSGGVDENQKVLPAESEQSAQANGGGLTEVLDAVVARLLPDFYRDEYQLGTTQQRQQDYPQYVRKMTKEIRCNTSRRSQEQWHGSSDYRLHLTIREILQSDAYVCSEEDLASVIDACADTVMCPAEDIRTKLDALSLLSLIVIKYPSVCEKNRQCFTALYQNKDSMEYRQDDFFPNGMSAVTLRIGLLFMQALMKGDVYRKLMEAIAILNNGNNVRDQIAAVEFIADQLEDLSKNTADNTVLDERVEALVLQNAVQWTRSDDRRVRKHAARILLALLYDTANREIVGLQLMRLVETDNVYIKMVILREINGETVSSRLDDATRRYILSRCSTDADYRVRTACEQLKFPDVQEA